MHFRVNHLSLKSDLNASMSDRLGQLINNTKSSQNTQTHLSALKGWKKRIETVRDNEDKEDMLDVVH